MAEERSEVWPGADGQWYRAHLAANGQTISDSEGYVSESNAVRAARDEFPDLPVYVLDGPKGEVTRRVDQDS